MSGASHRAKHIRLFGFGPDTGTAAVVWLLRHSGRIDCIEYIEVDAIAGEADSPEFNARNMFQTLPLLEVILDGAKACFPVRTPAVSDVTLWTPEVPLTVQTTTGKTVADPGDRVFPLTGTGAICTFLCEHFGIAELWSPRSVFQRCRVQELAFQHDLVAERVSTMVLLLIFTTAQGPTQDDISAAIAAHERELLWSFRILENEFEANERKSAAASGIDYAQLLEEGARDVAAQEAAALAIGGGGNVAGRGFTSAPLVALAAYVGGRALSVADFIVASELQVLPFLQAWLPASLGQRNFPAMLRYLARMRRLRGYDEALKPRLTLLKRFRRSPRFLSFDPFIGAYTARVRQALDLKDRCADGVSAPHRSDPRLLPQQHGRSILSSRDADKKAPVQTPAKRRGRSPTVTEWASRLCVAPVCSPCTLSDMDEALLRRSRRPGANTAQSATRAPKVHTPRDSTSALCSERQDAARAAATSVRSRTTVPSRAWRYNPYGSSPTMAVSVLPDGTI